MKKLKLLKRKFDRWFYEDDLYLGPITTNRYTLLLIILIMYVLIKSDLTMYGWVQ